MKCADRQSGRRQVKPADRLPGRLPTNWSATIQRIILRRVVSTPRSLGLVDDRPARDVRVGLGKFVEFGQQGGFVDREIELADAGSKIGLDVGHACNFLQIASHGSGTAASDHAGELQYDFLAVNLIARGACGNGCRLDDGRRLCLLRRDLRRSTTPCRDKCRDKCQPDETALHNQAPSDCETRETREMHDCRAFFENGLAADGLHAQQHSITNLCED